MPTIRHRKIQIRGKLCISRLDELKTKFLQALNNYNFIELDLSKLDEVDFAGLQFLFCLFAEAQNNRISIQIDSAISPSLGHALYLCGFSQNPDVSGEDLELILGSYSKGEELERVYVG